MEILPGTPEEEAAEAIHQEQPLWYDRSMAGFAVTGRGFHSVPWLIRYQGKCCGAMITSEDKADIRELLVADDQYRSILKAWLRESKAGELQLRLPAWEQGKIHDLTTWVQSMNYGWHEMLHIMNFAKVTEAFLRLKSTYTVLADGEQSYQADGQTWTVTVRQGKVLVREGGEHPLALSHEQASMLLTMPFAYPERPATPEGWYPLPVFTSIADEF